jgi:hypothetical protein
MVDEQQFDRLTRFCGVSLSRRVVLAALGVVGAMGIIAPLTLDEAANSKGKHKVHPDKRGRSHAVAKSHA